MPALAVLKKYAGSKARTYSEGEGGPVEGVVRRGLQEFVLDEAADSGGSGRLTPAA
jgi:hypothetical protein